MKEDSKIVELYLRRSEDAITETIEKYDRYLNALASKWMLDIEDAKECINDTYNGAWNSIPPNRPENLATYLSKILRNQMLMRMRKDSAKKRVSDTVTDSIEDISEILSDGKDFVKDIEAKELASAISEFLRTRKSSERKVFVQRYYYYEDIKSIALMYGFSESKVKMMLKRMKAALETFLRKEGFL